MAAANPLVVNFLFIELEKMMKRVLSASAIMLSIVCSIFSASALAQVDVKNRDLRDRVIDNRMADQQSRQADQGSSDYAGRASKAIGKTGLTECRGEFAYCGASTCKPTGKKIKVKEDGGKTTREYDEAACTCPIITEKMAINNGVALHGVAALNEGNMNGSCSPPTPGTIWSYAEIDLKVWPQESANFQYLEAKTQICPVGTKGVNCWNYLCKIDPKPTANGVKTATCFCPIGEGYIGHPTGGNESFLTDAGGYYNPPSSACSMYPVVGPVPTN